MSSRVRVDCAAGVASVARTALTTTASSVSRDLREVSRGASDAFWPRAALGVARANATIVVLVRTQLKKVMTGTLRSAMLRLGAAIRSAPARQAQKKRASRTSGWRATATNRSCATRRTPYAGFNRIRFQGTFSAAVSTAAPLAAVSELLAKRVGARQSFGQKTCRSRAS